MNPNARRGVRGLAGKGSNKLLEEGEVYDASTSGSSSSDDSRMQQNVVVVVVIISCSKEARAI